MLLPATCLSTMKYCYSIAFQLFAFFASFNVFSMFYIFCKSFLLTLKKKIAKQLFIVQH